jgi:hypothetical protein
MAEIVNLRLARKAAARKAREVEATASRLVHGRTRAEREATKAETSRNARLLEGARREGHD